MRTHCCLDWFWARSTAARPSPRPSHTTETVAYLAIEGDGTLTAANEDAIITRSTYTAAGQPIAFAPARVSGHPDDNNNGLFHIHTDHLGSVSVLTYYSTGYIRGNSQAYYYPFGAYRLQPSTDVTGRRFTGQQENIEWGLYYYNARYYVPYINRFLSADTIVPDPRNPQSLNRYSYSLNNPINRVDPTGHCSFDAQDRIDRFDCSLDEFDAMPIQERERWIRQFMVQVPDAQNWFNNILGIIEGFVQYGLADPGSWLSVVDAGILQGIQDGYAQSAEIANYYSLHPGAAPWREFFDALGSEGVYKGEEVSENHLISLWGAAEQISTRYGVSVANDRGLIPNVTEFTFLVTGNLYRYAASEWEGGLGTPTAFLFGVIGGLSGNDGDLSVDAGYLVGRFFNDPRSLHNGHSPVYWYSIQFWEFQEGLVWR